MKLSSILFLVSLLPTTAISIHQLSTSVQNSSSIEVSQASDSNWRRMNADEESETWNYILNSPLGIAALNQLAIEGFISPVCKKTFYVNEQFGPLQTLLQVKCRDPQGVSSAIAYDEMRVIFNRFEMSIESFEIERVSPETPPTTRLPE